VGDHGQVPNARSRPPAGGERAALAALLRRKSVQCSALGSPLYAELLQRAAADVAAGGVCLAVLRGHGCDPPGSALALRFMSAVHRAVLDGNAPRLARHYRSAGGTHGPHGAWPAFRELVADQRELLRELVCRPIQTNEAGRCAALLPGWLAIAAETRLPLRLLEVGASAGLILRFDRYRYEAQGGPLVRRCAWTASKASPGSLPLSSPHAAVATSSRSTRGTRRRGSAFAAPCGQISWNGCACLTRRSLSRAASRSASIERRPVAGCKSSLGGE